MQAKIVSTIAKIPASAGIGLANMDAMFSLGGAKSVVTSSFGTGDCSDGRHDNVLFGTNGIISRTLTYWESVIRDLFDLINKLRAEIVKMREEMERAREEWKRQREEMEREKRAAEQKAQSEAAAAELKAHAEATAAKQMASGLQDRLEAAQAALKTAEARRRFAKTVREARSPGISSMGRLQRQRMTPNRTGLTRDRVRARKLVPTDGAGISRAGNRKRRAATQSMLDRLIETGGPIHRPDLQCPPETDIIAYNDYRAQVGARARL